VHGKSRWCMGELFEELSKDLARGMSRRQALWRFTAGFAAAVGALLTGRGAAAAGDSRWSQERHHDLCHAYVWYDPRAEAGWATNRTEEEMIGMSVLHCPPGYCYSYGVGCVPVDSGDQDACAEYCRHFTGSARGECMRGSAQCPTGFCARMINGHYAGCVYIYNGEPYPIHLEANGGSPVWE